MTTKSPRYAFALANFAAALSAGAAIVPQPGPLPPKAKKGDPRPVLLTFPDLPARADFADKLARRFVADTDDNDEHEIPIIAGIIAARLSACYAQAHGTDAEIGAIIEHAKETFAHFHEKLSAYDAQYDDKPDPGHEAGEAHAQPQGAQPK